MKNPLQMILVYHEDFRDGDWLYDKIYKILCRDTLKLSAENIGIPVFRRILTDDNYNLPIDFQNAEKTLVLLLIDINLYNSRNKCYEYVKLLNNKNIEATSDKSMLLVPVALHKYASGYYEPMSEIQFISPKEYSIRSDWQQFELDLYDVTFRYLSCSEDKKPVVFLSHSKKDIDHVGEETAQNAKMYLRKYLRIDTFYDANDIMSGYSFIKQIEEHAAQGMMLVFFSDSYSAREWCRRELIEAKKNKVPIVVVFLNNNMIDRIFPYIGNVPGVSFQGDWLPIISLLLRTKLARTYADYLLSSMITDDATEKYLPFVPEAFDLSQLENFKSDKVQTLIYPEPPLGIEEKEILGNIKRIKYVTPMQNCEKNFDLKSNTISVSVSDSEDLKQLGLGKEMLRDIVLEISRHILVSNGNLAYGGDLRNEGYTELFRDLTYQYCKQNSDIEAVKLHFTNYLSWPIYNNLDAEDIADFNYCKVQLTKCKPANDISPKIIDKFLPPTTIDNLVYWTLSLTNMREQMIKETSAKILVGGCYSGFKGQMAGMLEEFLLAIENEQPVYLIGGFGGITKLIINTLKNKNNLEVIKQKANENPSYEKLCDKLSELGRPVRYDRLLKFNVNNLPNNGLTRAQNEILYSSTDIRQIVNIILIGLNNICNKDYAK